MKAPLIVLVTLITYSNAWRSVTIIPEKEDESCPVGESIPCNNIIDVNNTVLRYERGNLTDGSSTIPSEHCMWKIRGPRGTRIMLRTTCFHHFHVRNLTEYSICYHMQPVYDEFLTSIKDCSGGYLEQMVMPPNEANLSVYYDKGHKYALGFTMEISFIGEPLPELETTAPVTVTPPNVEVTTSGASPGGRIKFPSLMFSLVTTSVGLLLLGQSIPTVNV